MNPYYQHNGITIYHGDCRDILPTLPDSDMLFTSPPYLEQREYAGGCSHEPWGEVVPAALARANVSSSGQVIVNLGLVHKDGEVVCYWDALIRAMRAQGHRLFGWYVWDQGHGLQGDWNGRFAPSHEWLLHFNRAPVKPNKTQRCVSRGRRVSGSGLRPRSGDTQGKQCGHGDLVNPTKIPDSVVRVTREMTRRHTHPAVFPVGLAAFVMQAWGGAVLDPFMGSGTTLRAAKDLGRQAIGIEIEEKYCEIAARRLEQEVFQFDDPSTD